MSFWKSLFGGGVRNIAGGVAEVGRVFKGDKAARDAQSAAAHLATLEQFGAEFTQAKRSWFDSLVDGLNRLPRPFLAFSAIGLFIYALRDPVGFAALMVALDTIPEQLWWLLGVVITFYFGARETHHFRKGKATNPADVAATVDTIRQIEALRDTPDAPTNKTPDDTPETAPVGANAALDDWRNARAQD